MNPPQEKPFNAADAVLGMMAKLSALTEVLEREPDKIAWYLAETEKLERDFLRGVNQVFPRKATPDEKP